LKKKKIKKITLLKNKESKEFGASRLWLLLFPEM
jgi:hypothetical protein